MEHYDEVIEALHDNITEYRQNVSLLQNKFNDIKSIVENLETMKGHLDITDHSVDEILSEIRILNDKNNAVAEEFKLITQNITDSVEFFASSSSQWTDSLNNHFQEVLDNLNVHQASFQDNIEKEFRQLTTSANENLNTMDSYFQSITTNLKEEVEKFRADTKNSMQQVEKTMKDHFDKKFKIMIIVFSTIMLILLALNIINILM